MSMSTESQFQKDSLGWQMQKLSQRVQEWIEHQFRFPAQSSPAPEPWVWPEWVGHTIFWVLIVGFSSWLVWQLYHLLRPYVSSWRSPAVLNPKPASKQNQGRSPQHWWQKAQGLGQQGRYRDACLALYMGMLQQIHTTQKIPKRDSYTDGEYWAMLQAISMSDAYKVLLDIHADVVFGNEQGSEDLFHRCQQAYREIVSP